MGKAPSSAERNTVQHIPASRSLAQSFAANTKPFRSFSGGGYKKCAFSKAFSAPHGRSRYLVPLKIELSGLRKMKSWTFLTSFAFF
jgi:hypothetical protein